METTYLNQAYPNLVHTNPNIQNLAWKDTHVMSYVWLGVELSLTSYLYKRHHNVWAAIFGLISLGTAGVIIDDVRK